MKVVLLAAVAASLLGWRVAWVSTQQEQIDARFARFQEALRDERFDDAILVMAPAYRTTHSQATFREELAVLGWDALEPGRSLRVWFDAASLYPRACAFNEFWSGMDIHWVRLDGEWYLTGEYDWYVD